MIRQPMDSAELAPGAPGQPLDVTVTPVDGAAVVAWDRPAGGTPATRYVVTPVYEWTPLVERSVTVDGSAASALVRGLSNGFTYTARVTAWYDDVPGSAAISAPFQPIPPPPAPESVVATAGEQSVTVRWVEPLGGAPAQRYRVAASPPDIGPVEVPATQTSVLVAGLRNRVRYTFAVTAINSAGQNTSSPSSPVWPGDDVPGYLFPLEMLYLLVLGAVAYLYALHQPITIDQVVIPPLRDVMPPNVAGVPISIPWFGALGAVLIGLYGIFDHSHRDWQRSLNRWYLARPFTGAVLGTLGYIIFVAVIRATGLNPPTQDAFGKLVYFAVAFVVGFREETFRLLIKRVADLIVGPGQSGARPPPAPVLAPVPTPAPSSRPLTAAEAGPMAEPAPSAADGH